MNQNRPRCTVNCYIETCRPHGLNLDFNFDTISFRPFDGFSIKLHFLVYTTRGKKKCKQTFFFFERESIDVSTVYSTRDRSSIVLFVLQCLPTNGSSIHCVYYRRMVNTYMCTDIYMYICIYNTIILCGVVH